MSASDEIKDAIVSYFDGTDVKGSKPADWKRRDKRSLPNGETFRMYENTKLGRTVYTIGEDEDATIIEKDQWIYGFHDASDLVGHDEDVFILGFESQDRFLRTGYLYDQHQGWALEALFDLPRDKFDESSENHFVVNKTDYNELTIHIALKKLGFKFSRELTDWLMQHKAPTTKAMGPDLNAWEPAFLNPNYSAPLQPASSNTPAAAPQGVRIKNVSPSSNNATHQAQQQAMMAQIGQMAATLGATGGVQIGNVHIPAAAPIPGMKPLLTPPALPPSGIFNSPGMAAAMPLMASSNPELANLQPAVQAAFITQRMLGLNGLDQANPAWDDEQGINKLFSRHYGMQFTYEVERSQAIWLLYETTDDGSGAVLPDFFTMDNDELYDCLEDYGIIDLNDDDHDCGIIDDRQPYPPPYDLPVPQPAPAPAYTPPAQQRQAPMVGPASMNARAGSFAPLPAAPAAVAPPAPPPGAASAYINNDSGDKWAEFCGEVWETFSANKANLPLDLSWSDRYRPREASIGGLGYKFERREFTGIRILMGYLDRDGKLIETIDIPSAVLDDLMKEWGGDWNVDDITQFVNKRKGENPETGFSFSSEDLYDEVKRFLDGEGWKEA